MSGNLTWIGACQPYLVQESPWCKSRLLPTLQWVGNSCKVYNTLEHSHVTLPCVKWTIDLPWILVVHWNVSPHVIESLNIDFPCCFIFWLLQRATSFMVFSATYYLDLCNARSYCFLYIYSFLFFFVFCFFSLYQCNKTCILDNREQSWILFGRTLHPHSSIN